MLRRTITALLATIGMLLPAYVAAGQHESHEMEPKDPVAAAYATFASGDSDAWTKLHTENLTFTIFGQLPQSGGLCWNRCSY